MTNETATTVLEARAIVQALLNVTPTDAWLLLYIERDGRPAALSTLPLDLQKLIVKQAHDSFSHGVQIEVLRDSIDLLIRDDDDEAAAVEAHNQGKR